MWWKKRNEHYSGKVGCLNCNNTESFKIKKGTSTSTYIDDNTPKCGNCGCDDSIRMYEEYLATKDLIKDFIMHSHSMPHEEEEKEHGHFA